MESRAFHAIEINQFLVIRFQTTNHILRLISVLQNRIKICS